MSQVAVYLDMAMHCSGVTRRPTKDDILSLIRTIKNHKDIDEVTFRPLFFVEEEQSYGKQENEWLVLNLTRHVLFLAHSLYRDLNDWPTMLGSDGASQGSEAAVATPDATPYSSRARVYIANKLWDDLNRIPQSPPSSLKGKVFSLPPELRQKIFANAIDEWGIYRSLERAGFRKTTTSEDARERLLSYPASVILEDYAEIHQLLEEDVEEVWKMVRKFIAEYEDFDYIMGRDIRAREYHNSCCAQEHEHSYGYTNDDWCYDGEGHMYCTCYHFGIRAIQWMCEKALERLQD